MANYATSALSFDGNNYVHTLPYGECSTAAATAIKVVDVGAFALNKGARVLVKFTVTNTAAVANLKLNVSSTGEKDLKYRGGNLGSASYLAANRIYEFVYDGTDWELIGDINTNTTALSSMTGTLSVSHGGTGRTSLTANAIIAGNGTSAVNQIATASGALYATADGGAVTFGVLPAAQGGTGKTTLKAAANALINGLETGNSTPKDADYYISQYVGGGTSNTNYYRRPMSYLWNYVKDKADSRYALADMAASQGLNGLNINLLEEVDNMEYCEILTRDEDKLFASSAFFTDALYSGIYISPDKSYKVVAKITKNQTNYCVINIIHNNQTRVCRLKLTGTIMYDGSSTITKVYRQGGIYIVPVINKTGEFLIRTNATAGFQYKYSDGDYGNYQYAHNYMSIINSSGQIISHVGFTASDSESYSSSYAIDSMLTKAPDTLFCYWNATYSKYYLPLGHVSSSGENVQYLYYLSPNYTYTYTASRMSNYFTSSTNNYERVGSFTAGNIINTTYWDEDDESSWQTGGESYITCCKMTADKTVVIYKTGIYTNGSTSYLSCQVQTFRLSGAKAGTLKTVGSTQSSISTTLVLSSNYEVYLNSYIPHVVWNGANIVVYMLGRNRSSKISIFKFSLTSTTSSFSVANNLKEVCTLLSAQPTHYYIKYCGLLGFINGDESNPIYYYNAEDSEFGMLEAYCYNKDGEPVFKIPNISLLQFGATADDGTYSNFKSLPRTKDTSWGWAWLDLKNDMLCTIDATNIYNELNVSNNTSSQKVWTCPKTGTYKLILVGGGAAGGTSYGGGSGYLTIATRDFTAGDEIPYYVGAKETTSDLLFYKGTLIDRNTYFGDLIAACGYGSTGGANGYPAAGGGGGGGYNLVDYGGNGQTTGGGLSGYAVAIKNGGQGTMPAQGYGAGGCAGQNGKSGCIVIIR